LSDSYWLEKAARGANSLASLFRGELNAADLGPPLEPIEKLVERAETMAEITWEHAHELGTA